MIVKYDLYVRKYADDSDEGCFVQLGYRWGDRHQFMAFRNKHVAIKFTDAITGENWTVDGEATSFSENLPWFKVTLPGREDIEHFSSRNGTYLSATIALIDEDGTIVEDRPVGGPISREAAGLCNNTGFRIWMAQHHHCDNDNESVAKQLRALCGITSRAFLDHDAEAAEKYRQIKASFERSRTTEHVS